MRMTAQLSAAAIMFMVIATGAHAQQVTTPTDKQPDSKQSGLQGVIDAAGPSAPKAPISPPGFALSSSQNNSQASAQGTWRFPGVAFDFASLTGSVPLTSNASSVQLSTLDALANGFSLEFKLTGLATTFGHSDDAAQAKVCAEIHRIVGKPASDPNCVKDDFDKLDKIDKDLGEKYRRLYEAPLFPDPTWFWGANAKVGYQTHDYFDSASLAKEHLSGEPWSVGAFVAMRPPAGSPFYNTLFTLSYSYQYGFKDQKSKVGCPSSNASSSTCVDGAIGLPSKQYKDLVSLEARAKVASWLAFAVTPSYDANARIWAIDTPIYLVGNGKDRLAGGIDVGWRSDVHATTVGVFLSKAFSLTGQ